MGMTVSEAISTYRHHRKRLRCIHGRWPRSDIARQQHQARAEAILMDLVSDGRLTLAEDLVTEASLVRRLSHQNLPATRRPSLEDDLGYVRLRISAKAKMHGNECVGTQ